MATLANTLRFATRTCRLCRVAGHEPMLRPLRPVERSRHFTTTALRRDNEDKGVSGEDGDEDVPEEEVKDLLKRIQATIAQNENLDQYTDVEVGARETSDSDAESAEELIGEDMRKEISELMESEFARTPQLRSPELDRIPEFKEPPAPFPKEQFWNHGEDKAEMVEIGEDPEFEGDDITSMAHHELDQHREYRDYARIAAWEMPLLSKMAKAFEKPEANQILRFRYTTYMGEDHPAEKKVVVQFCVDDLPDLTQVQRDKVKKLVGARYNPETDMVKMSCEMFANQAQNKRYLSDLVDNILQEAKDPTDTFEDVPLDFRYHSFKTKPKFPREWRMTDQRRAQLQAARERSLLIEQEKSLKGSILDGAEEVKVALEQLRVARRAEPVPIATRLDAHNTKGKGNRLPLRR